MRKAFPIFCAAAFMCACGGSGGQSADIVRPFPMVSVPGVMTEPAKRAEYLGLHYWDAVTDTVKTYACDSGKVNGVGLDEFEQKFANYTSLLENNMSIDKGRQAVSRMYDRAWAMECMDTSSNVFDQIFRLAEQYFYDPNSPLRCEDLFQPFAAKLSENPSLDSLKRARYSRIAQMCLLNSIGTPAADFSFSDKNGRMHTLYGIKARHTILFFSNPGCEACKEIIQALNGSALVGRMLEEGKLAVANVYIDEDLAGWYDYMSYYPETWYNGFDPNLVVRTDNLYDVRAIPSLYLLDEDKTVIMKDAVTEVVLDYLANNQ